MRTEFNKYYATGPRFRQVREAMKFTKPLEPIRLIWLDERMLGKPRKHNHNPCRHLEMIRIGSGVAMAAELVECGLKLVMRRSRVETAEAATAPGKDTSPQK